MHYITKGNAVYAEKTGIDVFTKSMAYYDSAYQLANENGDSLLIAAAFFAKGKAYDAWNKDPEKTIAYYSAAANYYAHIPSTHLHSLYLKHLVAHAYDKIQDSANCIAILADLYRIILPKPDSIKEKLSFTAEMALISTEVKNYPLAKSILKNLTKRIWIKNDTATYDYLYHYYITQSRIALYAEGNAANKYIDSLETVFNKTTNLLDKDYYSGELYKLFSFAKNEAKASVYKHINTKTASIINMPEAVLDMQKTLDNIEKSALKKEMLLKQQQIKTRNIFAAILILLMVAISLLAIILLKRSRALRKKRNELYQVNQQLSQKNIQIELLNKEIHHRVKNNLQIINSLLFMQFKDNSDEKIKAQLKHSQERIKSMALVHNKLYESDSTVHVYIKEYIKDLAGDILKTNTPAGKSIQLNIEENEAVNLSLDTSVSLGLILNELITNACKYAFAGKETGRINIAINKQANGYQLIVKDDGSGLADDFHQKNSMGLRLVTNLSKQLGGMATFENNNGTVVIVDFVDAVAA